MKLRRFFLPAMLLALLGLASAAALSGCQTDAKTGVTSIGGLAVPTTQQVQDARDQAVTTLNATTQYADDLRQQVEALPPGDPVRKRLEPVLAEVQKRIADLQKGIDIFDAARRTAASGQVDPQLVTSAGSLFGIYGSLAAAVITGGLADALSKRTRSEERGQDRQAGGRQGVSFGVLHSAVPGNDHCNGNIAIDPVCERLRLHVRLPARRRRGGAARGKGAR
jgi:hypothetical protein